MLINIKEVVELTCLSKPSIYRLLADPRHNFPRPLKVGLSAVRWKHADVLAWIESREHTTPQAVA